MNPSSAANDLAINALYRFLKIISLKPAGSEVEFQIRLVWVMGSSPIGGKIIENKIIRNKAKF